MRAGAAVLVVLAGTGFFGQALDAQLAFEVASIRRNMSENSGGTIGMRPGGRWFATNASARVLVSVAYGVPANRVFGGPDWAGIERYVIEAVVGTEKPSPDETRQMLQALLRDRFNAVVRVEERELPVYYLVLARPDGRLGPRMQRSTVDCLDPAARKQAATAAGPDRMVCGIRFETGRVVAGGAAAATLEPLLTSPAGRPVIDRTGLPGTYDFELQWTPTLGTDSPSGDAVSIFTAVQEQLGLRLESGTAPLDVAVIERIERPTEN